MCVMDWLKSMVTKWPSYPATKSTTEDKCERIPNGWLSEFWINCMSITITSKQLKDAQSLDLIFSNSSTSRHRVGRLKITETDIREVPVKIAYFSNLTSLNLSCNKIVDLPWSIVYLRKLEILDLAHNELTLIPKIVGHLTSLRTLRLNNNRLTALPTSLLKLTRLREITVAENPLGSPNIDICLQGPQAIFQALSKREGRVDLWNSWMPWVSTADNDNSESGSRIMMPTLMELCVTCVIAYDVDFVTATYIPPRFKNELTEHKQFKESQICVAKCGRCKNFFSNKCSFDTHMC